MKCKSCSFENRDGVLFCEDCGERLAIRDCPDCGFANRPDVNFCEECGHGFIAQPVIDVNNCPDCGFVNRLDVNFCEECGHAFVLPTVAERKDCPVCGYSNRSGVNFCEECGKNFAVQEEPVISTGQDMDRSPKQKSKRVWSPKRRVWTWIGGVAGALALAGILIWSVPILANPPIEDFTPIMVEIEDGLVSDAREVAEQASPWVDPDSAEVEKIETEYGKAFMITFESEKEVDGFSPRMMILIDPVTGEKVYMEAP